MLRHVIDLYDCWWSSGKPMSVVVWKVVHTCLFLCLLMEMNDGNFQDRERTMGEIISMFSVSLDVSICVSSID
jgi:hypothetical protein